MILGEGAAMLVLEPLEAAQARGARIHAEIVGLRHVAPTPATSRSLRRKARRGPCAAALRDARLAPEQIGYINAHGTATPANDPTETAAIRGVFGAHAGTAGDQLHEIDARPRARRRRRAGGLATVLALRDGVLPPTANYHEPDPDCDLDVIPNVARQQSVEYALSNSFAFGGLNAVLALRAV